jgi:arginyl-tRNA--protein-N-Asp/Glu arginylyltransferase
MKINNECHHYAKYLWCERCSIHILSIIYFLQIVTNHNTSFILEEKIVRIRLVNEYSFQWYQLIIVSLIDDFSRFFRFNNVVFHLRSFQKFFSMRMSQHNFSMKKRLRQIVAVKFKWRCRLYFEFWCFRIEDDHHCYVKYEDFRHFFVDSSRVRKIFRRISNFFLFDNVDFMNAKVNISRD